MWLIRPTGKHKGYGNKKQLSLILEATLAQKTLHPLRVMADMSDRQYKVLMINIKCQKQVLLWHLGCECSLWGHWRYSCPWGYSRHPNSSNIQFIIVVTLKSLHCHYFVLVSAGVSSDLSGDTNRLFRAITQWSTPGWSSSFNRAPCQRFTRDAAHTQRSRESAESFSPCRLMSDVRVHDTSISVHYWLHKAFEKSFAHSVHLTNSLFIRVWVFFKMDHLLDKSELLNILGS